MSHTHNQLPSTTCPFCGAGKLDDKLYFCLTMVGAQFQFQKSYQCAAKELAHVKAERDEWKRKAEEASLSAADAAYAANGHIQ